MSINVRIQVVGLIPGTRYFLSTRDTKYHREQISYKHKTPHDFIFSVVNINTKLNVDLFTNIFQDPSFEHLGRPLQN